MFAAGREFSKSADFDFERHSHRQREKQPTVVGGVDAFEQAALGLEAGDAVPLAVEHLQPGEDRGVKLRQSVVPHVQLGHVSQQVRFIWDHPGDLIQPDRGGRRRGGSEGSEALEVQIRLRSS